MGFVPPDIIRRDFASQMSQMFKSEVPAYGDLVNLVNDVNAMVLAEDSDLYEKLVKTEGLDRLEDERHGAIRLGTAQELFDIRGLFGVMGMFPVGYYDLSAASVPVHSTAFRPIKAASLAISPFRVFTSLLRLDLIEDAALKAEAQEILENRQIFTPRALALINQAKRDGGLSEASAYEFIKEALETFRWHSKAQVSRDLFDRLLTTHRLIADVVSFKGPHINHLTPRILDIDEAQYQMPLRGIAPKAVVEGPPVRFCPILLRQTSFKALSEEITFLGQGEGDDSGGTHTARFGEIEQRGAALTPKGRALYDQLLTQVRQKTPPSPDGSNADEYKATMREVFKAFPDTWNEMRKEGLAYFQYYYTQHARPSKPEPLENWINDGLVGFAPIIYEDFLPVSAAGIFQSNLGDDSQQQIQESPNREIFIQALGCAPQDEFELYAKIERESLEKLSPLVP